MILPIGKQLSDRRQLHLPRAGFTLVELVLVMAILIVVLSMSGASLTSFFKGRSLEAEGKRFLALTRYAQNLAISEGTPMTIWIDQTENKYGLDASPGFAEEDSKRNEFTLGRDLKIEVTMLTHSAMSTRTGSGIHALTLRFQPDGFLPETNPEFITIKLKNEESPKSEPVVITPGHSRFYYEISTNQYHPARR